MNAKRLAAASRVATALYTGVLSDRVIQQLRLAHVAQWLYDQDESGITSATVTALEAITIIKEEA